MTTNTNVRGVAPASISDLQAEAQRLRAEAMVDVVFAVARAIGSVFAPLVRLGKRTAASIERQRQSDRILRELSYMTDRDLADIGLNRSDICAVADGTYTRPSARVAEPVVTLRPVAKEEAAEAELPRAA
jgi:uncharacterized protein YjiS (DUF1127 family)